MNAVWRWSLPGPWPPGRVAYHASKHAVLGMTKCSALEYAKRGIRINAVCPATIMTPIVEKMMQTGLGYGTMRLPTIGNDYGKVGVNYLDTS